MTDFFTMPGGTANLPDSSRSAMSYVQPPGTTTSKPDDGAVVRFNTIDWEARAKAAADGAEGLREVVDALANVASQNHFGDLVEGIEVHNRLHALVATWRSALRTQEACLRSLAESCSAAGASLTGADKASADGLSA